MLPRDIKIGEEQMRALNAFSLTVACLFVAGGRTRAGAGPAGATPAEVGLSAERLDRITEWLKDDHRQGHRSRAPSLMIARHGKIALFRVHRRRSIPRPRRR